MRVYKVVKRTETEGLYTSIYAPPGAAVWYKLGETTTPVLEGSKLMVFHDLQEARSFGMYAVGSIKMCVLQGETEKGIRPVFTVLRLSSHWADWLADAKRFWRSSHKDEFAQAGNAPGGSYGCKEFTPNKVVPTATWNWR